MDKAVANALKKIRKLENEISSLRSFIKRYEDLSGTKIDQDVFLSESDQNSENVENLDKNKKISRNINNRQRILKVAAELIRTKEAPMTRGEVLKGLKENGIDVVAKYPAKYVGTLLWRDQDRFESIEGRGYWVRELGEWDPS